MVPEERTPEKTLKRFSSPKCASRRVWKTKAEGDSFSADSFSWGEGKKSTTVSKRRSIPTFLVAEPKRRGVNVWLLIPSLRPFFISASVSSSLSKYFSMRVSSVSATASSNFFLNFFTSSSKSLGIFTSFAFPSSYTFPLTPIRSTTPKKDLSEVMGICKGRQRLENSFSILEVSSEKSTVSSSILFKNIKGKAFSSRAYCQAFLVSLPVRVEGVTTIRAVSATLSNARILRIKSVKPGPSKRLIL